MRIECTELDSGAALPLEYTRGGANANPPLEVEKIPREARSLVLFFKRLNGRRARAVRWVVYNIPVAKHIDAGSVPGTPAINDFERHGYRGPDTGEGSYAFDVYALDTVLTLGGGKDANDVRHAIEGHVIETARLVVHPPGPRHEGEPT